MNKLAPSQSSDHQTPKGCLLCGQDNHSVLDHARSLQTRLRAAERELGEWNWMLVNATSIEIQTATKLFRCGPNELPKVIRSALNAQKGRQDG